MNNEKQIYEGDGSTFNSKLPKKKSDVKSLTNNHKKTDQINCPIIEFPLQKQ